MESSISLECLQKEEDFQDVQVEEEEKNTADSSFAQYSNLLWDSLQDILKELQILNNEQRLQYSTSF